MAGLEEEESSQVLTVDITLTFICLRYEQVGDMPADTVFVTDSITPKDFLESGGTLVMGFPPEEEGYRTSLH